jgi:hypothetical protein
MRTKAVLINDQTALAGEWLLTGGTGHEEWYFERPKD